MARRIGRLHLPSAALYRRIAGCQHDWRKEAVVTSLVLETAAGLTFIFAIFAAAVSAISETVARYLGLRNEYLLRGIRTAVDGKSDFQMPLRELMPWSTGKRFDKQVAKRPKKGAGQAAPETDKVLVALIISHPLVASSARQAKPPQNAGNRPMTNAERRSLPSYLSGKTFAKALIDILINPKVDSNDREANNAGANDRGANHGDADDRYAHSGLDQRDARQLDALRRWAGSKNPRHKHLAGALGPLLEVAHDLKELESSIAD